MSSNTPAKASAMESTKFVVRRRTKGKPTPASFAKVSLDCCPVQRGDQLQKSPQSCSGAASMHFSTVQAPSCGGYPLLTV